METRFKIKLLRALTGLSQKELADLMGVSHFFISIIEKDKRKLPEIRANMLSEAMNIDRQWLTGESSQILAYKRFALFCYDGDKAVGASVSTLNRSISANSKIIAEYLPETLENSGTISHRYIWKINPEDALFFVVFGGHGLLLKVVNCKMIVDALVDVVGGLKNQDDSAITPVSGHEVMSVTQEVFSSISYASPDSLKEFIDLQDIDDGCKMDFKMAIDEYISNSIRIASGISSNVKRKTLEGATNKYVLEQKRIRFHKNCDELIRAGITLAEVRDYYKANGRDDLLGGVVTV